MSQEDFEIQNSSTEDTNIGVFAEYWRNPGSRIEGDEIDMSSLIMDALESDDSVIDVTSYLDQIAGSESDGKKE